MCSLNWCWSHLWTIPEITLIYVDTRWNNGSHIDVHISSKLKGPRTTFCVEVGNLSFEEHKLLPKLLCLGFLHVLMNLSCFTSVNSWPQQWILICGRAITQNDIHTVVVFKVSKFICSHLLIYVAMPTALKVSMSYFHDNMQGTTVSACTSTMTTLMGEVSNWDYHAHSSGCRNRNPSKPSAVLL